MLIMLKLLLSVLLLTACASVKQPYGMYTSSQYIRAHLSFIASDDLEGRETTKRGARLASDYIASQLRLFGVQPFGDDGSYFQNFPMYVSSWSNDSYIDVEDNKGTERFALGTHFLPFSSGKIQTRKNEIMFVGYGITDSLFNYDDYAGLDVAGKVLIMFSGEPYKAGNDRFFNGTKPTRWARSRAKRKLAIQKGAAGIILLPDLKGIQQFTRFKHWFLSEQFSLKAPEEQSDNPKPPVIFADTCLAKKIMNASDQSYSKLLNTFLDGRIKSGTLLPISIRSEINAKTVKARARNIVGIIPGNDPQKKDEYIAVGAHYDHLGIRDSVVYNGADDNGSGTTAILESARQLALLKENRRSIIYVFYTGEEKGLLGSTWFTNHFKAMDKIMANINMDMIGRGAADSLYVIGSGRISSEYFNLVEQANRKAGNFKFNYLLDDENHPSNIYHRSDHWNFAKHGIPIVFLFDYDMRDYHSPRDDFEKINIAKVVRVARLTTTITMDAANLSHWLLRDQTGQ